MSLSASHQEEDTDRSSSTNHLLFEQAIQCIGLVLTFVEEADILLSSENAIDVTATIKFLVVCSKFGASTEFAEDSSKSNASFTKFSKALLRLGRRHNRNSIVGKTSWITEFHTHFEELFFY